jgi:hypothetical protein
MKRPNSTGTASRGVHHVGKVVASSNCIFHQVHQENDVGNDGFIEFTINEEAIGCCIAVQIKAGESYVRGGRYSIPADAKHFEYWRSLNLPVAGIVYDPSSDSARWVDITAHLRGLPDKGEHSFRIPVSAENQFDSMHFGEFRAHFLAYRSHYGDDAHFARALTDFSSLRDESRCSIGARSLFTFHRGKPATWYYFVSCFRNFRGHPLSRWLIATLSHIPGHPDIFWHKGNITLESTRQIAEEHIRTVMGRDDVLMLLEGVDEAGFDRGQIGQCVDSLVGLIRDRDRILKSIIEDEIIGEDTRYWAALLLSWHFGRKDPEMCIDAISRNANSFSEDNHERAKGLLEALRSGNFSLY